MTWYAAHIVMVVKLKRGPQRRFPAWENIVLLQAADDEIAIAKAEAIGFASEGDDNGSFRWAAKPATWKFAGVRKVTECVLDGPRLADGDELTYSELEFDSVAAARRFAAGKEVTVRHSDQIRVVPAAEYEVAAKARRKRA